MSDMLSSADINSLFERFLPYNTDVKKENVGIEKFFSIEYCEKPFPLSDDEISRLNTLTVKEKPTVDNPMTVELRPWCWVKVVYIGDG